MKTLGLMVSISLALFLEALAQEFPKLSTEVRVRMLAPVEKHPLRIVFDTDTYNEIDDQFALAYALISPELVVEAVYAAPFHNSRSNGPEDGMEKSYEEILRVFDKLGLSAEGLAYRGSRDYLRDLLAPHRSPAALDLVARAKRASPDEPLYVVAVGAITNVASAILIEPEIVGNMVVVWLGGNGLDWPHQREFNFRQDLLASRVIFDSGVPLVQLPCVPVVTHFATTVPEMEAYLSGQGAVAEYLLEIFKAYREDHFAWSKVLWDMIAVAWVIEPDWVPSNLVHTPIVTDQFTFSIDESRHFMRSVYFVQRDPIFADFFRKLQRHSGKH